VKVVEAKEHGGPETLVVVERDVPVPGRGEALVRIERAGVNFIDVYHRTGTYPGPVPVRLGLEGAGVVERVGEGVTEVAAGMRVAWSDVRGSYATHVVAPVAKLVAVPDAVPSRLAAAAMLQGMTAQYLACSTFPLSPGHTCLVHAAAGGVGLLLCRIAKLRGARVFGTVSALARGAGADEAIVYTREDFADAARRLTDGLGVDVVYDSVGRTTFDKSLDAVRRRGMLVLFGGSSGQVPPFDLQILNRKGSLYVTRPKLADYTATREELLARASELFGWIARGELRVRIDAELPLDEAAEAHRRLEGRTTSGKVLLVP
jgi:NADPH2:quinone reductase